jgi:hypothetical protein
MAFVDIADSIVDDLLLSVVNTFIAIGCTISAPDGSSPRGYKGVLAAFYRLKYFLLYN